MPNSRKRVAWIAALIGVFFSFLVFVWPQYIDGMNGGFALSAFSVLLAISAFATAWVYARLARAFSSIINGDGVLATWSYAPEEWRRFTGADYEEEKSSKKILFFLISGFAVLFGIIFPIADPKDGIYVTYAMGGLIFLIGGVAVLSVAISRRRKLKGPFKAIVADNGVILGTELHCWGMFAGRLDSVAEERKGSVSWIAAEYSVFGNPRGGGRQSHTVRIPIPEGKTEEGREVAARLRSQTDGE